MNRILNIDLNSFEIGENEIKNVIGEVNKEMKLNGWILIELKNEECLIMNNELEEVYLLNKNKVLKMKGKDEVETRNDIMDKENGIRFEGSIFDDIPFGYGCLFDENGNIEYEGMMINWNRMGYGMNYNDKGIIEYEGYWCNNLRFGSGKVCDSEKNVLFEGNWFNGNRADVVFFL